LVYQALLPAELEMLKTTDINLEKGTVYIKGTNKTDSRELQLKPKQVMLFYEYLNGIRPKLLKGSENESY
jgi:integrase/recombinase XerD